MITIPMMQGIMAIKRDNAYSPLTSKEKTRRLTAYNAEKRREVVLGLISSSFKSCKEISGESGFALCTVNKDLHYLLDKALVEHEVRKVKMKITHNVDFYKKL